MVLYSKRYGPQVDLTDGTIGKVQLIRRFLLVRGDYELFHARQGRYSYATAEEAQEHCDAFLENNPPGCDKHHYVKGLHIRAWWCYPNHFDPVGPVLTEEEIANELQSRREDPDYTDRYVAGPST